MNEYRSSQDRIRVHNKLFGEKILESSQWMAKIDPNNEVRIHMFKQTHLEWEKIHLGVEGYDWMEKECEDP